MYRCIKFVLVFLLVLLFLVIEDGGVRWNIFRLWLYIEVVISKVLFGLKVSVERGFECVLNWVIIFLFIIFWIIICL